MEIKITLSAPELAEAINNLAAALKSSRLVSPVLTDEITNQKDTETSSEQKETVPTNPIPSVPVAAAPQYTIEQIMNAGAKLMDDGKIDELRKLIKSFGVEGVTFLKSEQLGAFATELRKLGARI